jgi:hypothetical protein
MTDRITKAFLGYLVQKQVVARLYETGQWMVRQLKSLRSEVGKRNLILMREEM